MAQKWGESFLKSGLPLEYLTVVKLRSCGWYCDPHYEYLRTNRDGDPKWFEVDVNSSRLDRFNDGTLVSVNLLVECKYNDMSRFWFFLPYENMSLRACDDDMICSGPFQPLESLDSRILSQLAPHTSWGGVVSRDGREQPNAVYEAVNQLSYGFIAFCLFEMYESPILFNIFPRTTVIALPIIVTNASLYRIRPEITDLSIIRSASSPGDIADELPWTWYYSKPSTELVYYGCDRCNEFTENYPDLSDKWYLDDSLAILRNYPRWFAIVNVDHLVQAIETIQGAMRSLKMTAPDDAAKMWLDLAHLTRSRRTNE